MGVFRDRKFLHRMVFSYTIVFSLIFFVIIGVLFLILDSNYREQSRLTHQMLVGQPLKQVDRFLSEMDSIAYKAMTSQTLIRKFTELRGRDEEGNHYERDILDSIDTATALGGINARVAPARRIAAYNERGDFISSGAVVDLKTVKAALDPQQVTALMERFRSGEATALISLPQQDRWMPYFQDDYITMTRPIMNEYSRDVVGIVEVQRNAVFLEEYLRFEPERELSINVYDGGGHPILLGGKPDDRVVATAVSESYGWQVELLEPTSVALDERRQLVTMLSAAWLLLSVAVLAIINIIASRIAKPLTDLTEAVRGIHVAEPEKIHVPNVGIQEIESLESAFNQMLDKLTLSLDQEKKSFLLAMQAQMNPHFLYNVLSVINAVALEGRSDVVVDICGNLSGMLRYSASYVQGSAAVREEMQHAHDYLELMKARYDYMFEYSLEVDGALEDVVIPKLIVQPVCENCFTHGFSDREPPYRIAIRLKGTPEDWFIEVTDNGSGFPEETRLKMLERANNASYADLNRMQIGGLGLVSSVVRLKLFLGTQILCDIQPEPESGSRVIIRIRENGEEAVL